MHPRDPLTLLMIRWVKDSSSAALLGMTGRVIGVHQGLHNYTIGQRQGINVGAGGPYYVVKKDLKTNALYVTNNPHDPAFLTHEVQLHSVNWIVPNIQYPISNIQYRRIIFPKRTKHDDPKNPSTRLR